MIGVFRARTSVYSNLFRVRGDTSIPEDWLPPVSGFLEVSGVLKRLIGVAGYGFATYRTPEPNPPRASLGRKAERKTIIINKQATKTIEQKIKRKRECAFILTRVPRRRNGSAPAANGERPRAVSLAFAVEDKAGDAGKQSA